MEKKFVIFGIILMMLFLLGSCNSEEEKLGNGTFYNLEEAYDLDLLSVEDLQSIAYYYRGSEDESFVPKTKNPETLSQETESKIKQLYLDDLKKSVSEAIVEDIYIAEYYGSYGDCVVVKVWDNIVDYDLFSIPE
jgi:hypothetical protein